MKRSAGMLNPIGLDGRIAGLRLAFICAASAGISSVLLLAISGWFLTGAALAGAAGAGAVIAFNYLLPSAAIRGLAIVRTTARYGERVLSHTAALRRMADIRVRLFGALAAQDGRTAQDLSGGDASARLIGDIGALENAVVRRPARPATLVTAASAVLLVLLSGWPAALALAAMLAILPFVTGRLNDALTRSAAAALAEASGDLRVRFVESSAARSEIITYGIVERIIGELDHAAWRVDHARAMLFRGEAAVTGLLTSYGALAATAVLILSSGTAPIRALALLAALASVEAMASFARDALSRRGLAAGLERLSHIASLDVGSPVAPRGGAAGLAFTLGTFELASGRRVAITGASGSGKTWLIEALAGLRPAPCDIMLGARPIAECTAFEVRDQSALSPQDATLIAGTIADNLRLARPGISSAEMWGALDTACLADRIRLMPGQLDSRLDEAGGMLSGGERKRLSLARALLAGRPWLLLDEPTEGLDAQTEQQVIARLLAWLDRTGAGLILVSHRSAPLAITDRQLPIEAVQRELNYDHGPEQLLPLGPDRDLGPPRQDGRLEASSSHG